MKEIGDYLKVINDNIFIIVVLIAFIIVGVIVTIDICKWLVKIIKILFVKEKKTKEEICFDVLNDEEFD
tara:strand:- start:2993 stop:3199 length:207 start_codon:yes stop_codon:yes gene_type:complete